MALAALPVLGACNGNGNDDDTPATEPQNDDNTPEEENDDQESSNSPGGEVTVYSGRGEELVGPIL
jgi:hypothetical protein